MTLSQIKKFENLNDISVNVYAIEDGIIPIRPADRKRSKHVNLLLPSEDDKWLEFKKHCRKELVPFVVYADLQCALEKMDKGPASSTYTYQHHNVFSIGYYVYCSYDGSLSGYRFRHDNNCIS
ncbi:hypothetical protein ALC62_07833 [Cyphomyrmex costatus]|uniref:Uncharacterized protein n=1 Tax=Cyphomyrmex costatus TaxID=456900 RepID=A0A151IHE0_9HYME|nr:hypothetical protein ALC62_07833 [Cyphomyrmex costatus]